MTFEIKTPDDLRRLLVVAEGGDPDAQQTLNEFLKFKNNIERSNLPTRRDVVLLAYLDGCSRLYYPDNPKNPFALMADGIATAFMAKGGDKSKQFVELMRNSPDLTGFQNAPESAQRSITDRIFGRGKTE